MRKLADPSHAAARGARRVARMPGDDRDPRLSRPPRRRRRWWSLRRGPRRDEDYIWFYPFPEHVEERCRHHHPELSDHDWKLIEQGLREWFLCCAWRDGEVLGMPSQLVDEAWHEFILDSRHYTEFCERAFGEYLHHTPESSMTTPMPSALDATTRAWDRAPGEGAAVLWSLDATVGSGGHHHHDSGGEAGGGGETGGGEAAGSGETGRGRLRRRWRLRRQ
jgi:hypothetical protein